MKAEYVDHMGTDLSVVNAARVSFDKVSDWDYRTIKWNEPPVAEEQLEAEGYEYHTDSTSGDVYRRLSQADTKLINYLARGCSEAEWWERIHDIMDAGEHGKIRATSIMVKDLTSMATHWTPFTHTAITLRMQAPVPIRTQCFKHKQGFTENEESRRYISGSPDLYIPLFREKADEAKQGSGGKHPEYRAWGDRYWEHCVDGIHLYEDMIDSGVCPEQARFVLPQGVEVQWIWTGNLASYARFYNQRTDPHAQKETQDLARMVGDIIEPLFPVSWKALTS